MLDTITKRRIDTARDILVGKLPDPKSQVEQITIALIYKFMDDMDKQSEELEGKTKFFTGEFEKYSWSKIFDPRVSGYELVGLYGEAIQKMNHNPNIPQLFRNIFKNAYLPYRDPETLKMFLKVIGEFEYDYSEKLGDAFEYLLSIMGSQGDAGQFRTPRHIINFMVKVVDPSKNETILDPACGTAGFLISSFNHIQNKNKKDGRINLTPDERARLIENLSGYDISPDMVRLSRVNMYLHKFPDPKIYEYDTLASEEKWNEFYDIILANPPFMSPMGGIKPHKRFSVQANRSEVLFVDYIEEHLNPNGRAGVIVPEGIIFQSGIAYKKLRKMLIENSLYAVVSLPAGVFNPYSGVKTSILFLNKNLAKKTDKILFVKVNNDGFGLGAQRREIKENDLPLALEIINKYKQCIIEEKEIEFNLNEAKYAHVVKKEKVAESGDYNLSGDRYKEVVAYNGKWDFVELGEVCEIIRDKPVSFKGEKKYFSTGAISYKYHNKDYEMVTFDKKPSRANIFPSINDVGFAVMKNTNKVVLIDEDYYDSIFSTGFTFLRCKKQINFRYLYYLIRDDFFQNKKDREAVDGIMGGIRKSDVLKIKIPLPPLEIQEQIVAELDSYQKIIDGAKQVVENYKPTFKIEPEWEIIELDKICKPEYGYSESAKNNGEYRYIRITDISEDGLLKYDEIKYVDLNEKSKKYILKKGDVLVARTGATYGKTLYFDEEIKAIFAGYLIRLNFRKEQINSNFYWIFSQSSNYRKQKNELVQGGGQPQFNANAIKHIKVPLPSLEIQEKIVVKIVKEQKIINANKELITIFENKIKDKIAEVWG
jgi:type I restriction enzyme M protein